MSSVKVVDSKGAPTGELEIPASLTAAAGKGRQALHDAVVAFQNGLRAGTASTKGKGAVAGSGKKPWRQKGTGRARAGYRRSPVWRGGGVAFGPKPRSYAQRLPKKTARLAFLRAFTDKVEAGDWLVVENIELATPKTKAAAAMVKALGLAGPLLLVLEKADRGLLLATRNLPGVAVATASNVHTVELMRAGRVVATRAAMDLLTARLAREEGSEAR